MKEKHLDKLKNASRELEGRLQCLKVVKCILIWKEYRQIIKSNLYLQDEIRENQIKQKEISTSEKFDRNHIERYEATLKDAKRQIIVKEKELKKYTEEASSVGERLIDLRLVNWIIW